MSEAGPRGVTPYAGIVVSGRQGDPDSQAGGANPMGLLIALAAAIPIVVFLVWLVPARRADLRTITDIRQRRDGHHSRVAQIDRQIAALIAERTRYTGGDR